MDAVERIDEALSELYMVADSLIEWCYYELPETNAARLRDAVVNIAKKSSRDCPTFANADTETQSLVVRRFSAPVLAA